APEFYERGSYTIHEVKIDSPLGWLFGSVDQKLKDITSDPEMPIKKPSLSEDRFRCGLHKGSGEISGTNSKSSRPHRRTHR
ncbi:MAG: hypothetical protein LC770_05445, partial [Acidobacteria bacterium]|nr:hypothetical protein [Acidobacteriota bacterium]